jgi:hypothetical protein
LGRLIDSIVIDRPEVRVILRKEAFETDDLVGSA